MKRVMCILLIAVMMAGVTACSQPSKEVKLEDVHTLVKDAYGEDYLPNMTYDPQVLTDKFGITEDLYEEYIAEGPMISVQVDEFIAIKSKKGKGEEVQSLLEKYRKMLLEESLQYPMNMPKIEASEVWRHGDYVFFVMLGTPDMEAEEQSEEAALESAKQKNQIAIQVLKDYFKED